MFRLARTLSGLAAAWLCLSAPAVAGEGAAVTAAPTHLLVVDKLAGQLVGVDLASGEAAWRVDVGAAPHEALAVPADVSPTGGPAALVSLYGSRGAPGSSVAVVDLAAREVAERVSTRPGAMPHGLALVPGTATVLVTVEANDAVLAFELSDPETRTFHRTGRSLPHMVVASPDGGAAYAANIVAGAVTRIDLPTGETASARVGAGAEGLALTPDGAELWVGSNDEHEVHVLWPADLETLDVLPTCRRPIRVAPVGERRMAVTCHADSEVLLFDAVSHERVGSVRLPVGSAPVGTLASPDGARLFVAATATGIVYEIDVGSSTVVRTFVLGGEPDGMALVTLPGSR